MTSIKTIAAIGALALHTLATAGISQAANSSDTLTMKPRQGISFDVGSERAVSYFLSDKGQCKLVVTMAGEPVWEDADAFAATRFEVAILAGKSARYVPKNGHGFAFDCHDGASTMSVRPLSQYVSDVAK